MVLNYKSRRETPRGLVHSRKYKEVGSLNSCNSHTLGMWLCCQGCFMVTKQLLYWSHHISLHQEGAPGNKVTQTFYKFVECFYE